MTLQEGRDGEEVTTRRDGMTENRDTAQRAPEAGMSGARSGVDSESVDVDSSDLNAGRTEGGAGRGTAPALRISSDADTGGAGVAGDEGFGQGADMDLTTAGAGDAPTGTPPRAGLGGTSSGDTMDVDPTSGSGMANPADMGDQG